MFYWSNDLQCARNYQSERGGAGLLDEGDRPCNYSQPGEDFDDTDPLYGSQVHLRRPLTEAEVARLEQIESSFDIDGDFPAKGKAWDIEGGWHSYWLNFDYFSAVARAYLESLPD